MHSFSRHVSLAAGFVNIAGVLTFSAGFTNPLLSSLYPSVFSKFGLVCIILWGLAYIAAGLSRPNPLLYGVFAIEKAVYGVSWLVWLADPASKLSGVFEQSALTGTFYALYGPIDWTFCVLFSIVAWKSRNLEPGQS